MLMRKLHPAPIINILFTERCFFSKSSKMRESTLLCVMYALLTFPSTEFNIGGLVTLLLQYAPSESKKRVRQSLLDTFAVLAQFVPRSHLKLSEAELLSNESAYKFNAALQARLARRQLPSVSPEGLILYSSRFPPTSNGADHQWVRQGSGSWNSGNSTTSSNLLQSRRLSSSDPWMPQDDNMSVRGVGTLRYPSSGNLLGKNDVDFTSYESFQSNGGPPEQQRLSPNYNGLKRSVSPSKQTTYYPGSMSDLQNGNLPLPPIPTSKPDDTLTLFYQQQKDFQKLLDRSNDKWNNNLATNNQSSGQSKSNEKMQKSEISSNSQPSSPAISRRKNSVDLLQPQSANGTNNYSASSNTNDNNIPVSPNRTPKKSPAKTPTKLPKSIYTYSTNSQNKPSSTNGNVQNKQNSSSSMNATNAIKSSVGPKTNHTQLYPSTLPPFEKPKEAMNKILAQLESSDWEATTQGLQGVVRMARHHTKLLATNLHACCTHVSKQVRSLRSQVARAACQTACILFTILGRQLEPELEELAKVLLSRAADTNKFLRADSYEALVAMVTSIQPIRTVPVILSNGAKHQSAIVRSTSCQLLLHIVHLYTPERLLSLPHDLRNSCLIASAKFLLEGSLETRTAAKELFVQLSKEPKAYSIIKEVLPHQLLASCNKTLVTIFRK
uniref:Protein FAM179B n=1 Tax=Cacopsylla melanoneura TaxID=428564 RepID=A0A8D8ZUH6_9HEMI